ncbi:MAG: GFA family protein [Azospirillaceae bacterium]
MAEARTYRGGCHCGAVRFEVTMPIETVFACNCSYCQMRNHRLAFTQRENFTLLEGADATIEYLFNRKIVHHRFCRICGIESYAYGTVPEVGEMVAINTLCLDGVSPEDFPVTPYDGRSR